MLISYIQSIMVRIYQSFKSDIIVILAGHHF